jgi:hypothetical protein
MKMRETAGWTAGILMAAMIAACAPVEGTGPDRTSRTEVMSVTWTDNQPAYQVNCELPGGCGERINAVCKHGPHRTLKTENMPGPGNIRDVQKPASVVFRCG